ncbi:hypothetical protein [Bifidobacterium adolescentis]|nr:hypothetical protein [Bifidobacterium adolescentis]MBS6958927.1 hypothetical protein [Pseudomonadota bacterium]MDB0645104.1 hypothetical protein [Bifidobacterium adolescentis]MDB1418447.1 hypothetical protein [Bifidobacterium adolescentis]MDB1426371.1 hypothetical protein [Bifidobacterium adolescentis]MDB1428853.1 hypothetical protein [Bifidobacterium adolescentis]
MAKKTDEELYDVAINMIGSVAKLPVIRVDREAFLRQQFVNSEYLDEILEHGPQHVYTAESLRRKADGVIKKSTNQTTLAAFVAGIPGGPMAVAAGSADVAQYFGVAINLAQKIAYLFGEDDLLSDESELSEDAKVRILVYLGVMFGASGAAMLIGKVAREVGKNMGKKVAQQALMKTAWYPLLKKIGALVGKQVVKESVGKAVAKVVPVVGGAISGAITYATFKPMGGRLADTLVRNLNGEFDQDGMELRPEFKKANALENDEVTIHAIEIDD